MKKAYSLVIAIIISICASAQNPIFSWAKGMGNTLNDNAYWADIAVDGNGNVLTTGSYQSTTDFDPGAGVFNITSVGQDDIFISKLDAAGNFIWAKSIGSTGIDVGYSIITDASNNIYVTGYFINTADFDPGAGVFNLTSAGNQDIFVLKLDASGNFVWAQQIAGPNVTIATSIDLDAAGNIYLTGSFASNADFDPGAGVFNMTAFGSTDIFVCKLNNSGNFVWAQQLGGAGNEEGNSVKVDAAGNVYSTGYFASTPCDFDPSAGTYNLSSAGSNDIYISKLSSSGSFVWAKQIGSTGVDNSYCITLDANNVYLSGSFRVTTDFDPGAGVFNMTSLGSDDAFILKLDNAGNFTWAKQTGSTNAEGAYQVFIGVTGNIYMCGYFQLTPDFDPGAGTYTMTSFGSTDAFITKLDVSGNFLWAGQMGGTMAEVARGLFIDANESIYTTGPFASAPADFDPGAPTFTMTTAGAYDIFVTKYVSCVSAPSQPSAINGLTAMCAGAGSTTYSIASVVGATSYTWNLPGGWSGSSPTNTISATPGTTGLFTVTASNACGASPQQTLNVTVNPLPTITVNSGSICSGNSFTMVAGGANTYTFSSGPVVTPTITSSYSVAGTSTAGCVSASSAISNVTVNPLPTISASTTNTMLCVGQSATITAGGASTYTFNPGGAGTNITVSPTVTANYTITGTNSFGCTNSSVFTQSVSTCAGINQISNAVSETNVYPNPFNSKITIVTNGEKQSVQVFNALGSLINKTEIENEKIEIDLGKESSGIYFIRIGTEIKKIIKE